MDSSQLSAAQQQAVSTLQRKTKRVLQIRPEKLREELSALSEIFPENTIAARRSLRTTVEVESLRMQRGFLSAFEGVEGALEELERKITSLGQTAEHGLMELREGKAKTRGAIGEAQRLREKRAFCVEKRKICESFLRRFRLTEEELNCIRCADAPIDTAFFAALDKVDGIRRNCRVMARVAAQEKVDLMDVEVQEEDAGLMLLNQNSAIDVLQETSEILDIAYERLFISVQNQCRRMSTLGTDLRGGTGRKSRLLL